MEKEQDIYKGLINMANYLRVGLKKLQNTYKNGTTVGTIQYYIIVLTAIIEGWFRRDMLYIPSSTERESFLNNDESSSDSLIYSTIFDVEKFKHFWTKDELKSLCTQFDTCFKNANDNHTETIVFKDDDILDDDDLLGEKYIVSNEEDDNIDIINVNNNNTNDTKTKNCAKSDKIPNNANCQLSSYPSPKSQNNVIVKSQLLGINNILSLMDKRFTTMLNHSVKGAH